MMPPMRVCRRGHRVRSCMNVMNKRVPTAPNNEPPIHGIGEETRDHQGHDQADPKQRLGQLRIHRAWNCEHDCIVNDFHNRDGERVGCQSQASSPSEWQTGSAERTDREGIPKQKRENDGQRDGGRVAPA